MKVNVDQMKCGGVGMCVRAAPEIFRFQEGSKKATVIQNPVPQAYHEKVREAARQCPNEAVIFED